MPDSGRKVSRWRRAFHLPRRPRSDPCKPAVPGIYVAPVAASAQGIPGPTRSDAKNADRNWQAVGYRECTGRSRPSLDYSLRKYVQFACLPSSSFRDAVHDLATGTQAASHLGRCEGNEGWTRTEGALPGRRQRHCVRQRRQLRRAWNGHRLDDRQGA